MIEFRMTQGRAGRATMGAIAVLVLLGACGADGAPVTPTQASAARVSGQDDRNDDPDRIAAQTRPSDTCNSDRYERYIGADSDTASQAVVDAVSAGNMARVTGPGIATTRDYRIERVNLDLDDDGRVSRLMCG